jgi:hypothetical protein
MPPARRFASLTLAIQGMGGWVCWHTACRQHPRSREASTSTALADHEVLLVGAHVSLWGLYVDPELLELGWFVQSFDLQPTHKYE